MKMWVPFPCSMVLILILVSPVRLHDLQETLPLSDPENTLHLNDSSDPEATLHLNDPEDTLHLNDRSDPEDTLQPNDLSDPEDTLQPNDLSDPEDTLHLNDPSDPEDTLHLNDPRGVLVTLRHNDTLHPRDSDSSRRLQDALNEYLQAGALNDSHQLQDTLKQYLHEVDVKDPGELQDMLHQYLHDIEETLVENSTRYLHEQNEDDEDYQHRAKEALKNAREALEREIDQVMRGAERKSEQENDENDVTTEKSNELNESGPPPESPLSGSMSPCRSPQPQPLRLPALPNAVPDSLDEQCARDSRLFDLHLRNHTLWAVQMQDAGACGITGLLEGNVYHLGDFDECLEVDGPVRTQYCVAEIRILTPSRTPDHHHHPDTRPDPMQSVWNTIRHEGEDWRLPLDTVHVALCAPASCPPRHLQAAVQRSLAAHANCSRLPLAFSASIRDALCTSADKQRAPFSTGELAYIALLVLIFTFAASGTLIDVYATKKKGCSRGFLLAFSLPRNWRLLTKADPRPAGLDLTAMSGARTINMLLLVLAHRGFNLLRGPVHNYTHFEAMPRHVLHTGATHAQLFVDTCFVMSGLLVSLLELTRAHAIGLKHCDSEERPGLLTAVMHRYVRLTPSYAMVVFFYATIFWRMGSGPLWDQVIGHESEACAKYWWTNLFYVNNYINTEKLCMFQSWYLPCDLHLFVLGTALTLLLARHRRTGLAFIAVFLAASVTVPFVVTVMEKKPALLEMLPPLFRAPDQSHNFRTMYAPTHIRAAPYMIGLLVGYLFHLHGVRVKQHFSTGVTWLLCLGGVALTTAAMLSSVVFYDPDMTYQGWVAGAYAALCPVAWSAGVCLVFTSLVLGSKTPVSMILSWRPLVVLSRLTYNVYLTHWGIQMASVAKMRTAIHFDVYNLFSTAFGDMVSSFIASVVLFMLVEAPFRSLARRLTAPPPESTFQKQFHIEEKPSSVEGGITGAIPKHN